jgi:hypothetical protein
MIQIEASVVHLTHAYAIQRLLDSDEKMVGLRFETVADDGKPATLVLAISEAEAAGLIVTLERMLEGY